MSRIEYNAPVILTFSLLAIAVHLVNLFLIPDFTLTYFAARPSLNYTDPMDYFRLTSHVLGHADWRHLFGNLTFILLLGPMMEEKYGSAAMLVMIIFTALFTGGVNALLFSTGILGASGVVFMLIILASIVDFKRGSIPLTFILVAGIFIGAEVIKALRDDAVSQTAHIAGGAIGAAFGFMFSKFLPGGHAESTGTSGKEQER